jgi:hypothetical protein
MVGKCKLCGENKKLCQKSHIIPNFMYQDLFDEENRIHAFQVKNSKIKQLGSRQTGEFDKYILCPSCDNKTLGRLDTYVSLILYDGYPKTFQRCESPNGMKYISYTGIDYVRFKLFLLSVLWRASISTRPLFREVRLGPHEERIRQMLLNSDPGEYLKYPCVMMTYRHLKDWPVDIVTQASHSRANGGHVYKFMVSGMLYIFFISDNAIPTALMDVPINRKGEIKIILSPPRLARRAVENMTGIKMV